SCDNGDAGTGNISICPRIRLRREDYPHQWLGDLSESFLWLFLGGNSGIGKATAVDLARRGARVILACRDKAKGESAVYDIRRVSKARPFLSCFESGNSEVILMILDLASLNSVRAFAQSFLASEPRLDILINNAGVFQAGQTADGFDLAFQVNHLSHFLLTHLLLDQLKCCAPSRIVILSSSAHTSAKFNFGTLKKPNKWMMKGAESYCNSKLANILHARELAKRLEGTNVTCYVVHPGDVNTQNYSLPSLVDTWFAGAQTSIHCATEEGIERLSGRDFVDCQPKPCLGELVALNISWERTGLLQRSRYFLFFP
uniref:Uncharacterized protein n=1 Tax=Laticauda laticaudata TaxID=8630 RepID=A0A8C5RXB0_LATLA